MKSATTRIASCVGFLAWLAGCGNAPSTTPVSQTPTTPTAPGTTTDPTPGTLPKPAPRSLIHPVNILSAGLVSLVALSEGSGNSYYDAATRQTYHASKLAGTPPGAQPPIWFVPTKGVDYPWGGMALQNNGATAQAITSNLPPSQFISASSTGYSYAVLMQPLDATTFGRILDGTGAAVVTIYLNIPGAEGTVATTWRNAAGKAINPKYTFTQNKWVLVLCTVQQGLGVMYVNGVEVARDSTVDLAQSTANQTGGLVYNATGNGSGMANANFSSWWVWNNRVINAQEAAELYADPWAMLR